MRSGKRSTRGKISMGVCEEKNPPKEIKVRMVVD